MATQIQYPLNKRLMKSGGSLYISVPNEVIEEWNLSKGDEVNLTVEDGVLMIEPKQPSRIDTVSEETVENYAQVMKGIEVKMTMDTGKDALHLDFSGENKEAVKLLIKNLWKNLPALFSMLGVGSIEEDDKTSTGEGS